MTIKKILEGRVPVKIWTEDVEAGQVVNCFVHPEDLVKSKVASPLRLVKNNEGGAE